ncbi:MAG: c(7)-type cytochrome triheme domain-containing protein [Candidatus Ozemobacteraceae bacterium]
MRKTLLACVVSVLLIGVYAFIPASADPETKDVLFVETPKDAPQGGPKEESKEKSKDAPEEPEKKEEPTAAAGIPAMVSFENVGKLGVVEFNHKLHCEKSDCKSCHECPAPLFEKKISKIGRKMSDMYAGKDCGFCHNGKDKCPFNARKACGKCHKK